MTIQWEYQMVFVGNGRTNQIINEWGVEGWELVQIDDQRYAYFKRKVSNGKQP